MTAFGAAWIEMPTAANDPFGPFVLVQEFADSDGTFVVGTVWRDDDGDGEYDPGEGVEGATVSVGPDGHGVESWSQGSYQLSTDGVTGSITVHAELAGDAVTVSAVIGRANVLVDIEFPRR